MSATEPDPLKGVDVTPIELEIVCSWCGLVMGTKHTVELRNVKHLGTFTGRITHSCCEGCLKKHYPEEGIS